MNKVLTIPYIVIFFENKYRILRYDTNVVVVFEVRDRSAFFVDRYIFFGACIVFTERKIKGGVKNGNGYNHREKRGGC